MKGVGKYFLRYFNGFSLSGEERFFGDYLIESDLCVAGFSYGAQQALEYTLRSDHRIDRLILLSPAFFQNRKPAFIRTQLRYFAHDRDAYISQFLSNIAYPAAMDVTPYLQPGSKEELESLLGYVWEREKLEQITQRGTVIEVFLGGEDRIIDAEAAFDFFSPLAVTYLVKDAGHLLLDKQ